MTSGLIRSPSSQVNLLRVKRKRETAAAEARLWIRLASIFTIPTQHLSSNLIDDAGPS